MNEGPHYPMSVMPLVEENRRLHEENRLLKAQLEMQAVQWDQWLDMHVEPNLRKALATVRVDLTQEEFLFANITPERKGVVLAKRVFEALEHSLPHAMQILRPNPVPLYNPNIHSSYTFSFLGVKK